MNNDLISRSELKSVLENECFWCANKSEPCDKPCWHCINEKIDNAPTVEPERPHGEWVSKHLWDNTHAWVCSECGNRNTHGITVEKACWRCGAEMNGIVYRNDSKGGEEE